MWLFTTFGFFSIVRKPADTDRLTVRARARGDLLRLRQHYLPELGEPAHGEGSDYPWRATCPSGAFAQALPRIAEQIDYGNFKDEVAVQLGAGRARRYGQVWSALYGLDDDLPEPALERSEGLPWKAPGKSKGKAPAYGGVVFDPRDGRVLLREVAGHYDEYVWTFAKGRPEPGEPPRAAALREVKEEMGVEARLLLPLPGVFPGGTTVNHYFLMTADARQVRLDHQCKETARLAWATPDEARRMLAQTGNLQGRERDLAVLEAALSLLPPLPWRRPIARREDWKTRPMPARRAVLPVQRKFTPDHVARLLRGYIPAAMEEKWFAHAEDGIVRLHRSWTGHEVFRLHLAHGPKGWWLERAEVNRHPGQFSAAGPEEELEMLDDLLDHLLSAASDAPWQSGLQQALQTAMQPNYLGSPEVVDTLLRDYLDTCVRCAVSQASYQDVLAHNDRVSQAMSDDPGYTRMPWHSVPQLGAALVDAIPLDRDYCAGENLYYHVTEALAAVHGRVLEIMEPLLRQPGVEWERDTLPRLQAVAQFLGSLFLGTQALTHPGRTLADVGEMTT